MDFLNEHSWGGMETFHQWLSGEEMRVEILLLLYVLLGGSVGRNGILLRRGRLLRLCHALEYFKDKDGRK
jgi:hypothetical protein